MPVLLQGETGTGKTSLIKHLCHLTNTPMRRINLNGNTTVDEFVGKTMLNKNGTIFVDGILTEAMRKGYVLLVDEINAGLPEINIVLNSVLERSQGGKLGTLTLVEKDGEVVTPHPSFRIFATMNPSDGYSGVTELNLATMSRFGVTINVPYPSEDMELKIVKSKLPQLPKVADAEIKDSIRLASDIRNGFKQGEYRFMMSTRDIIQWMQVNEHYGDLVKSAEYTVLGKCNADDRHAIGSILKVYFSASTEVSPEDGKIGEKYRKGMMIQVCQSGLEIMDTSRGYGNRLGFAKKGSVFEVVKIHNGETYARLLKGDVYDSFPDTVDSSTVKVKASEIIKLRNIEQASIRRIDVN